MHLRIGAYWCLAAWVCAAQPASKLEARHAPAAPRQGIKTPGIQIPFTALKPEAEFALTPQWLTFTDAPLVADEKSLYKIDAKKNELATPVAALSKPCGGAVSAFKSLWIPACADGSLVRLDPKTWKVTATVAAGTGAAKPALAATADSVWLLSDNKTTLSRIDPDQNAVVAELRLPAACNTVMFGENALWATCPNEDRVLRLDAQKNLVDKQIEVAGQPKALAIGEGSIWVYCQKDGKIDRVDPKTNKVIKTIDLGVPGVEGTIAIGAGAVWVSQVGFPLTRIDPATDKVVQQFWGVGGGTVQFGSGSLWLGDLADAKMWRVDPKRVLATLAE
jgi:virginiamycin B lyase